MKFLLAAYILSFFGNENLYKDYYKTDYYSNFEKRYDEYRKYNEINYDKISKIKYVDKNKDNVLIVEYGHNKDEIKLDINSNRYTLYRSKSASGEAFESYENNIYFAIKGKEAVLEINGLINTFIEESYYENTYYEQNYYYKTPKIYNFEAINRNDRATLMVYDDDSYNVLRINGLEYNVYRIESASGEAYESLDSNVYIGIKNKNGIKTAYITLYGESLEYRSIDLD